MNILQAHKYYWRRDGASNYMIDLSCKLRKRGNNIAPFALEQAETLGSNFSDYFVKYFDLSDPQKHSFFDKIRAAARMIYNKEAKDNIEGLLEEANLDIAHLHNIYHHISPSILPPLKQQDIPIVMTLHDYKLIAPNYTMFHHGEIHEEDCEGWYLNCIKNKCMKDSFVQSALVTLEMIVHHKFWKVYENCVDHFIAPSKFMRDICIRHGWPEEKFSYLPNPINADEFKYSDKEGKYVAYIGRLVEEKGLEVLFDAAKELPEIPFYITGTGELEAHLQQRKKKENLDNIHFDGFLSGNKLKDRIRNADMLILPSIWYENYPISVLEAKAMGRLVIGSNIGGISDQLPKDLVVEPGDSEGLAKTIEKWFNKPQQEKKKMRSRLRSEVEDVNDPDKHVEQVLEIYNSLR